MVSFWLLTNLAPQRCQRREGSQIEHGSVWKWGKPQTGHYNGGKWWLTIKLLGTLFSDKPELVLFPMCICFHHLISPWIGWLQWISNPGIEVESKSDTSQHGHLLQRTVSGSLAKRPGSPAMCDSQEWKRDVATLLGNEQEIQDGSECITIFPMFVLLYYKYIQMIM